MAIKTIPLTISRPGLGPVAQAITVAPLASAGDSFQIPFRYPFADIANVAALRTAGFFRHGLKQYGVGGAASGATSSELNAAGDSAGANASLGYQLPHTEKLFLLVQLTADTATAATTITVKGNVQYSIPDEVISFPAGTSAGLYEIPLFDFGLFITRHSGVVSIEVDSSTTANETKFSLGLVSRAG
jgi:hypothetical protein